MLSDESLTALILCTFPLVLPFVVENRGTGSLWPLPLLSAMMFAPVRAMLYFLNARDIRETRSARDCVSESPYARSLGARLRESFLPPVLDIPIPGVGIVRVRFFADYWSRSAWMRLRLRSPVLDPAPWVRLQGSRGFWLPTAAVGARKLTARAPDRHWRYWRLPWRAPEPIVEDAELRQALPFTMETLVLTSRPGHILVRADCDYTASVAFEKAMRLLIAWVQAVQRPSGAPVTRNAPHSAGSL